MNLAELLGMSRFWADIVLIVLVCLAVFVVHWLIYRILRSIAQEFSTEELDVVGKQTRRPSLLVLLSLGIITALYFTHFPDEIQQFIWHVLQISGIFASAWMVIAVLRTVRMITLQRFDMQAEDNLRARKEHTRFRIIERVLIALIILIAFGAILMTFESVRRVGTSLLASAGVAGIIIGFAAQRSISTLLAGIQIALTQPIRLEDAVVVEGEWGWIEEINMTYVVIRIWDLRRLIVPINYFIEKPFQNWTRTSAEILGSVMLYTDYQVPFEELRQEMKRIVESTPLWNKRVQVMQVTEAKADHIEIRFLVSARNSPEAWDLRVLLREKLIEFLQKNYPESLPRTRVVLPEPQGNN